MTAQSSRYTGGAPSSSSKASLSIVAAIGMGRASHADSNDGGMRQHPLLVLEQLSSQCVELHELRLICEQLCARLTLLATRLDDDSSASSRTEQDDSHWSTRVETLIAQFADFVERNTRSNAVRRLTDVHRLRELYELQVQVDAVFRATRPEHVDIAPTWQLQWHKDVAFAETQLQRIVTNRELLRRELSGSSANLLREALVLVKFAAENLQLSDKGSTALTLEDDEQAEYRASQVILFKRVFRLLLTIAQGVAVPVIPAWFISPNDITVQKSPFTSDSGGAAIHYGEWLPLAKTVIVKRVPEPKQHSSGDNSESERAFMREALMWYPLNHPNVLKILGGCHVSTPPFLVFESPPVDSQTLDDYLLSSSPTSRPKVFQLLYQAALGLQYLHEQQRLVHNDLQCRNILVSADGKAQICNFARATSLLKSGSEVDSDDLRVLNCPSSLRWAAPEALLENEKINFAADIYGLGMCILEAGSGNVPWGFLDDKTIEKRVTMGQLPELDDDEAVDPEVWRLITAMCSFEPSSRPAIASVADSLRRLAERERRENRDTVSSSSSSSREQQRANNVMSNSQLLAPDYSQYRHQLSHSRGSRSETKSVNSDTSSSFSKDDALQQQLRAPDTVSVVTLHQKWLGIKINSIGTKIVVSKFLRSASGAMGEIEASGSVQLGDTIYAVNNQTVRGMNRHQIGSFIQSIPRPLQLSFKREAALLEDCFRFNGLRIEERWQDRGSALPLPGSIDRLFGSTTGCFSFEIWFSLADVPDSFLGGILFGAQDTPVEDASWPYIHRQLVNVDPHGNLCVSLLNDETPALVARELAPSIWYHLVVTYSSTDKQLAVYLDGELRHSGTGSLHRDWQRLGYANVGSGCISGLSPAKPTPNFTGWYGFNGLVYDFKIWRALLGDLEVHQLFRGATDCVDIPSYAMKRDFRKKTLQGAQYPERVRATRPQHVVAQVY